MTEADLRSSARLVELETDLGALPLAPRLDEAEVGIHDTPDDPFPGYELLHLLRGAMDTRNVEGEFTAELLGLAFDPR